MLALGLILILLAVATLVAMLVAGPTDRVALSLGAFDVETTALVVFLLGAATLLVFVFGLEMARSGVRRANKRRREHKELERLKKSETRSGTDTTTRPESRAGTHADTGETEHLDHGDGSTEHRTTPAS